MELGLAVGPVCAACNSRLSRHGSDDAARRDDLANGVVVGIGHEEISRGIQSQSLWPVEPDG